jgi:dethiobiotin synthetase
MSARFVIAGTDTGVGKTVFAAALAAALDATYWKPIQCGLDGGGDKETVRTLSGLPESRILDEAYRLKMPASPHIAAAHESVVIDETRLTPPPADGPLIIEGAGGLMVPITDELLQIDLLARWKIPVILVARTALGTINHSLLSIEALNTRAVPIHGVAFAGEQNPAVQKTIVNMGRVHNLGRLNSVDPLNRTTLAEAFRNGFSVEDFA